MVPISVIASYSWIQYLLCMLATGGGVGYTIASVFVGHLLLQAMLLDCSLFSSLIRSRMSDEPAMRSLPVVFPGYSGHLILLHWRPD
jgi:hypothetical protein